MRIVTFLVAIGALANFGKSAYAQFNYEAVPYILALENTLTGDPTGDEYTISGTITTSCNDCETGAGLSPTDIITNFNIEVGGPDGLVFDKMADAFISPGGAEEFFHFSVTPSSIQIVDTREFLSFSKDLTDGQVEDIRWQRNSDGTSSTVLFVNEADFPMAHLARLVIPSSDPLLVATAVPEPGSVMLIGLGGLGLWYSRRRK
jgi:hypothetical protein